MPSDAKTSLNTALRDAFEFHRRGRYGEAERLARAILKTEPEHFEAQHLLGACLLWQGQFAQAEQEMRRAVALNPAAADARVNLGAVLRTQRRTQEALACFEAALEMQPDLAEAHYARGF